MTPHSFSSRGARSIFFIFYFISFRDENHVSKQNSPRWDAALSGVIAGPGAILFATMFVPLKGREAYMALNIPSNRESCGSVNIVSYIVKMQCL